MRPDIEPLHARNLNALALTLDAVDPSNFGMAGFFERLDSGSGPSLTLYASTPDPDRDYEPGCGTVACAVGHGPRAGIEALPGELWANYSRRVFGIRSGGLTRAGTIDHPDSWKFLFIGSIARFDNTPAGAAARIRCYLEEGVPDAYLEAFESVYRDPYSCTPELGERLRATYARYLRVPASLDREVEHA
jgi:hypothetical protein